MRGPSRSGSMPRTAQRAAGQRRDAADHPHRRGLAGAVGAEEAERFAGRDVEVDGVDGGELAEPLRQPAGMDERGRVDRHGLFRHGRAWYRRPCHPAWHEKPATRGSAIWYHRGGRIDNQPRSQPWPPSPPPPPSCSTKALVAELTVVDADGSTGHLPAHPAVGRRARLHDVVDPVQPQARAHRANPQGLGVDHRPGRVDGRPDRVTIQGDARVIADDPHGGWERLLPIWSAKEPAIVSFLKARVALPLFFERALIEIVAAPRPVLAGRRHDDRAAGHRPSAREAA